MSTGVIGEMLPMDKIRAGMPRRAAELGDDEASLERAARGMMTTDTRAQDPRPRRDDRRHNDHASPAWPRAPR